MVVSYKPDQRQPKNFGIGASEIAAIAGLNPYSSPWDIWLRKTGQAPDDQENQPIEWGHRLEPAIRQKYVDTTNAIVYVPPESLYHAERTWARATPDGIVVGSGVAKPERWQHLLQCKNVGAWVGASWEVGPPIYVQLQEQWELYVTGLARADVAVLIGGNDWRMYSVHRDPKMIEDLVVIADDFWRKVETRKPPPIDESEACKGHFEKKYAKGAPIELQADADLDEMIGRWRVLTLDAKRTEREIETIRNHVRAALADAQAGAIVSTHGTARLQTSGGKPNTETNWKLVAELLASKCSPEEFAELVAANTTTSTTPEKTTLYAPKTWAKEKP